MDWILLVGLMAAGALLLIAMVALLRFQRPRRLPTWVPVVGLVVTAALFALSIVAGSWLTAGLFALNMLTFSMLLGVSRRRVQ